METILVATDFSEVAAHALDYAAALAADRRFRLLLVHVYDIPFIYTGDGLSLYTINDGVTAANTRLQQEQQRIQAAGDITIETTLLMGGFRESLASLEEEQKPVLIIMGAGGPYTELWQWDDDWLDTVTGSACPVLIIPAHIQYSPFRNIAFACDYKHSISAEQATVIRSVAATPGARLQVIHVSEDPGQQDRKIQLLKGMIADLSPEYHFLNSKHVVREIARFVQEQHTDLLLVTPHQHGLWYNLFNKSYTRQLAQFNMIPVIAIPDK